VTVIATLRTRKRKAQFRWGVFKDERAIVKAAQARRASHRGLAPKVLIGPANSAGQATSWTKALQRQGVDAHSLRIAADDDPGWYSTDLRIERLDWRTRSGRTSLGKKIAGEYDGLVLESLRPLFALRSESDFSANRAKDDLKLLRRCHIKSALVFHGSDIRDTQAHALREEFSPYRNPGDPQILRRLQDRAQITRTVALELGAAGYPLLVTTPDLFLELPTATWLPIAIDFETFASLGIANPAFTESGPLRVLYQPSRGWLKSHAQIEPVLRNLEHEGLIRLVPNDPIEHARMPARIASADLVIDRFDGITGVLTAEALACGRAVIANVAPWAHVRAEVIAPVHHATPATLGTLVRGLVSERQDLRMRVESNREFVRTWHDGRMSADRIKSALFDKSQLVRLRRLSQ
jgi:hypothetical protein